MKTIDDIRTVNKSVHFRPTCNLYNINELATLWEKKIGRTLPRVTVTENDLLAAAAGPIHLIICLEHMQLCLTFSLRPLYFVGPFSFIIYFLRSHSYQSF
jgi:hypothetical protein